MSSRILFYGYIMYLLNPGLKCYVNRWMLITINKWRPRVERIFLRYAYSIEYFKLVFVFSLGFRTKMVTLDIIL